MKLFEFGDKGFPQIARITRIFGDFLLLFAPLINNILFFYNLGEVMLLNMEANVIYDVNNKQVNKLSDAILLLFQSQESLQSFSIQLL